MSEARGNPPVKKLYQDFLNWPHPGCPALNPVSSLVTMSSQWTHWEVPAQTRPELRPSDFKEQTCLYRTQPLKRNSGMKMDSMSKSQLSRLSNNQPDDGRAWQLAQALPIEFSSESPQCFAPSWRIASCFRVCLDCPRGLWGTMQGLQP